MASPAREAPGSGRLGAIGAAAATIAILATVVAAVLGLMSWRETPGGVAGPSAAAPTAPVPAAGTFLYASSRLAPPIALTDKDGQPFSLASLRGRQVLLFFGYTHCPDVCPATIGNIGKVLSEVGSGTRALFISIDPERDTVAWLKEYSVFLPAGLAALTGTPDDIRITAQAWGVRYARVETGTADAYSMSHTADVFLVDAAGFLRADFPFGTGPETITQAVRLVAASGPAAGAPVAPSVPASAPTATAAATPGVEPIRPEIVSTSVWADARTPVILALNDSAGRIQDPSLRVSVTLVDGNGGATGPPVEANAVQPPGENRLFYVASLGIPAPGQWQLDVSATGGGRLAAGSVELTVLDPGGTPPIGSAAPSAHTPTLTDVGGIARAITTDPQPDLRLSSVSTTDALAEHRPFVLVIDSPRFRVSPACGKAVIMARYLADRWPGVAFIHLEPYQYTLVTDTPTLSGNLTDPPLSPIAAAWGSGSAPWGARSMPWLFVVDKSGVVRAKYQGLMGTDDVDVILAALASE